MARVQNGMLDVENPHMQFEEAEVALAKPRRGHQFYNCLVRWLFALIWVSCVCQLTATTFTLSESKPAYENERITASQNGGESDTYKITVPSGGKATVRMAVSNIDAGNIRGRTIYVKCNGGTEQVLSGDRPSWNNTFTSDGTVTVGVRCYPDEHQVPYNDPYLGIRYRWEEYKYYSCTVTYSISVSYEHVKVTFNANGGSGDNMSAQTFTPGVWQNLKANRFTRTGYSFKGWATSSYGSVVYSDCQRISITSDMTLYAVWEKERLSVTFDANGGGGKMSAQTFIYGESQKLTENRFLRTGYSFMGWATSSSGKVVYSDKESIKITSDMTLYAVWEKATLNVTFNANGGSGKMSAQSFTYGMSQRLVANTFTRTGYSFMGWAMSSSGKVVYSDEESIKITSNIALYAVWEKATLSVTFNANGGSGKMSAQSFTYGKLQRLVANTFTRTGYSFKGWAKSSYGSAVYSDCQSISITSDLTLYAVWEKATLSVTFNANGGVGTMSAQSFSYDVSQKLTANTFTRTGYSFKGWATSSYGDVVYSDCQSISITSNLTLYAVWEKGSGGSGDNGNSETGTAILNIEYGVLKKVKLNGATSVVIPSGVTSIGDRAFFSCSGLTRVTIPNSVTSIGDYAFGWCSGLTYVTIPNSVTNIGEYAFFSCDRLTSVTIPASATIIGEGVFGACDNLISLTVADGNPSYKVLSGLLLSKDGKTLVATALAGLPDSVAIPDGVMRIGDYAFRGCSSIKNVTIPNSVTSIGEDAFAFCTGLTSVALPNSVTNIGDEAFYYCRGLTSVMISNSVTNIGDDAFYSCTGLTNVTIPASVKRIGEGAFDSCLNVRSVTVEDGNPSYMVFSGLLLSKDGKTLVATAPAGLPSNVTIPNGVTNIWKGAFAFCDNLASVTIPDGVMRIGDQAFYMCNNLTSATIPDSVTSIGASAFSGCSKLTSVTIPDGVTSIESLTFYLCRGLTSVTIPDSVMSIGSYAFDECYNATFYISNAYNGPRRWSGATVIGLSLSPSGEQVLSAPVKVSATCVLTGSEMRYTTDGTMPTMESPIFSPFTVKSTTMVTVGAFVDGKRMMTTHGKYWFGEVSEPEIAVDGSLTFTGNQSRRVSFSCDTADSVIHYTIDGSEPTEDSTVYSQPFVLNLASGETVKIRARAFKMDCKPSAIAEAIVTREWMIGEGLNATNLTFATGGDASWVRDISTGHGDGESLRSGSIANSQSSSLEMTVEGMGQISFWWKTSCKATDDATTPCDHVEFMVDGVRVTWLDGEKDWLNIEWSIKDAGEHVLRWVYVKDDSNAAGLDCAWLDDVTWQPVAQHKVTFDANGGEGGWSGMLYEGSAIMAPTVTWTGYTFKGWKPEVDEFVPDHDVSYVAQWESVVGGGSSDGGTDDIDGGGNTGGNDDMGGGSGGGNSDGGDESQPMSYTVTFDANGGNGGTTRTVAKDAAVGTLLTVTRSGYTFDGWFTAAEGGDAVTDETVVTSDVTYYARWTKIGETEPEPEPVTPEPDPVTPDPVTPEPVTPEPEPTPTPVTPDPVTPEPVVEEETYGGKVENVEFTKAQTVLGALYDAKGELAGTVDLKFGKINKKQVVKVSGAATLIMDGKAKKITAKAVNVTVDATKRVPPTTLAFKAPIGNMTFAMDADGVFTLKSEKYEMVGMRTRQSASLPVSVGGAMPNGTVQFNVAMDSVPDFGKDGRLLEEALPVDEPIKVSGGKWSFGKAASLKYAKNKATGAYELIGLNDSAKPNVSGLKLTYTAKTGLFKGSFKLYATNEVTTPTGKAPKLKKFTVNVIGFVVDGKGYGEATLKKPAGGPWAVTVQ